MDFVSIGIIFINREGYMNPFALLAITFALAFLAESLVEYIFGTLFDKLPALAPYKWTLMYVALVVGVGMAFFYGLDLIALISQEAGGQVGASWLGILLTGLVVGRGSNFLHEFVSKYLKKPDAAG